MRVMYTRILPTICFLEKILLVKKIPHHLKRKVQSSHVFMRSHTTLFHLVTVISFKKNIDWYVFRDPLFINFTDINQRFLALFPSTVSVALIPFNNPHSCHRNSIPVYHTRSAQINDRVLKINTFEHITLK